VDDPDIAEKMAAEVDGILLWAFEGLQRLVKNGFQFTESDRAKRNRELVKRDNNNVFDFLESEGYIRLKADACTSSKELYEVYKMWCEENSLNAIKARGFSDALIANQRRYNLESTNNIVNSSGRRVRGFVGIEALVQPGGHDPLLIPLYGAFSVFRCVRAYRENRLLRTHVRSKTPKFSFIGGVGKVSA